MQKSDELIQAQKRLAALRRQHKHEGFFQSFRAWRRYFLNQTAELRSI